MVSRRKKKSQNTDSMIVLGQSPNVEAIGLPKPEFPVFAPGEVLQREEPTTGDLQLRVALLENMIDLMAVRLAIAESAAQKALENNPEDILKRQAEEFTAQRDSLIAALSKSWNNFRDAAKDEYQRLNHELQVRDRVIESLQSQLAQTLESIRDRRTA